MAWIVEIIKHDLLVIKMSLTAGDTLINHSLIKMRTGISQFDPNKP